MAMQMSVSQARARLGDVLDTARVQRQPVFLTRHGKRVGVISGIEQWQSLDQQPIVDEDPHQLISALRAQMAASIKPGTPPLLDVDSFYETRDVRL